MKNKSVLNSPRLLELKKKRNKILRKKIFFVIFIFLIVLIAFSFLSKWQRININNIEITGNKVIETKQIEEIVKEKISGDYLYFFPKTNFLLYPKQDIKNVLANKFKRLDNIDLSISDFKTLKINVSERIGLYTWCGESVPDITSIELIASKCYFLDQKGFIFDEAPYFSGEIYTKFYGNIVMPENDPIGLYFFEPNFQKLISFKEAVKQLNLKIAAFYLDENGDINMYFSSPVKTQLGPKIIFKQDADYEKLIENLQSVLTTEPLQTDFKNKYGSLLYIDLRFGNKVYYKFK